MPRVPGGEHRPESDAVSMPLTCFRSAQLQNRHRHSCQSRPVPLSVPLLRCAALDNGEQRFAVAVSRKAANVTGNGTGWLSPVHVPHTLPQVISSPEELTHPPHA